MGFKKFLWQWRSIRIFYPDGTVTFKTHIEYYEDWGSDYNTKVSTKDYHASGKYSFLEKTSAGEIIVSIKIIDSENYAGNVIEAKIIPESFELYIKAKEFINKKFYY